MLDIHVTFGGGTYTPPPAEPPQFGALPLGEASYTPPGDAVYIATTGNDSTGTGSIGAPFATMTPALAAVPVGGTIVYRGGTYHEGAAAYSYIAINKAGVTVQNYPGEAVIFDGSSVVTGWVVHAAGVWKKAGWTFNPPYDYAYAQGSTTNTDGFVDTVNYPCAHMPDMCFIDGVAQQQVNSLAAVADGKFFIDRAADVAYIGTDPTGKEVRLSDLSMLFIALAVDVSFKGFQWQRFANPLPDQGVVRLHRDNGLIENCIAEWNATTGMGVITGGTNCTIRNNTSRYNGLMGLHVVYADGIVVEGNDFDQNNQEWFNSAPSVGACKATRTQGATFRGNRFANTNRGPGLWLDEVVYDSRIYSNDMEFNGTQGLHIEICDLAVVADNRLRGNGLAQLLITSTDDVRLWCNTIAANEHECVVFQQDNRDPLIQTSVRDNRQPASFYETTCTWWMDSFEFENNVMGESRYTPLRVKQYNYTGGSYVPLPSKGWAAFGIVSDGNLFNRTNRTALTSPSNLTGAWSTGVPGTEQGSATLTSWRSNSTAWGRAADLNSMEITGVGVLADADLMLTATALSATAGVGRPLPEDIALMIGQQVGSTHLGAWR